jgi:tetratricopeptide (TPR) repeat protein
MNELSASEIVDVILGRERFENRSLWEQILQAHEQMFNLQINQAVNLYQAVIKGDLILEIFKDKLWPICSPVDSPNLTDLCIYLQEYFMINSNEWSIWLDFSRIIFDSHEYSKLADNKKSFLISSEGWAKISMAGFALDEILSKQFNALNEMNLEILYKAHHYRLIGHIYTLQRKPELAFDYINRSIQIYEELQSSYHLYQSKRSLARTLFYLNNFDSSYFDKALAMYKTAFNMIASPDATLQSQYYFDIGTVYLESKRYEQALDAFEHGYTLAYQSNLDAEVAHHEWGMARVYYLQGQYTKSLTLLWSASLEFELNHQLLRTAMCLQVEAACLQKLGRIDEAIELVEMRALRLQRNIDDPVQLYHTLRRIVILHLLKKDWCKFKDYYREYFKLKREIKK